jgi:signal transduction histidine kinase
VQVKLKEDGEVLMLTVADDGRGFDTGSETTEQQLGVQGMYERAELIGAMLEVISEEDKGTIVRLSKENGSGTSINL